MDGTSTEQTPPNAQEPNSIGQHCTSGTNTVYNDLSRYTPTGERIKVRANFPDLEETVPRSSGIDRKEILAQQTIEVYPIPTSDKLIISWNGSIHNNNDEHSLIITDAVSGRANYSENFLGAKYVSIDVNTWTPGLYILLIRNNENGNLILQHKVVIQ